MVLACDLNSPEALVGSQAQCLAQGVLTEGCEASVSTPAVLWTRLSCVASSAGSCLASHAASSTSPLWRVFSKHLQPLTLCPAEDTQMQQEQEAFSSPWSSGGGRAVAADYS